MNTSTYLRATASRTAAAPRARPQASERPAGHRLADYIVDVFFVALLAAPFLIFEAPASVQDAVAPLHGSNAAVAASAPAGTMYGPE